MARITGIEINDKFKVDYALTNIKGIGWVLSKRILDELKIDSAKRVGDLTKNELSNIAKELNKYPTEGELTRQVRSNITRLKTIGTYRGMRHNQGLPSRGQRTRSNARNKRGKRKTVGAFRKEALSRMQQQKK